MSAYGASRSGAQGIARDARPGAASPFRATALERYASTRDAAVAVRRPPGGLLLGLWLLVLLALAASGAWLLAGWHYLFG
ncbi:MAG TPA: hypothetical protein VGJ60_32830 [Chloroflexota bacterium]